jgi:hypothetical protein
MVHSYHRNGGMRYGPGSPSEGYRIRTLLAHSIAQVALNKSSPAAVAQYRDDRLRLVKSGTVRRELAIIQHCFEVAKREWGLPIPANLVQQLAIPEAEKPRERCLEDMQE